MMNFDLRPFAVKHMPLKVRNDLRLTAAVTGAGFVAFVFVLCARLILNVL